MTTAIIVMLVMAMIFFLFLIISIVISARMFYTFSTEVIDILTSNVSHEPESASIVPLETPTDICKETDHVLDEINRSLAIFDDAIFDLKKASHDCYNYLYTIEHSDTK